MNQTEQTLADIKLIKAGKRVNNAMLELVAARKDLLAVHPASKTEVEATDFKKITERIMNLQTMGLLSLEDIRLFTQGVKAHKVLSNMAKKADMFDTMTKN